MEMSDLSVWQSGISEATSLARQFDEFGLESTDLLLVIGGLVLISAPIVLLGGGLLILALLSSTVSPANRVSGLSNGGGGALSSIFAAGSASSSGSGTFLSSISADYPLVNVFSTFPVAANVAESSDDDPETFSDTSSFEFNLDEDNIDMPSDESASATLVVAEEEDTPDVTEEVAPATPVAAEEENAPVATDEVAPEIPVAPVVVENPEKDDTLISKNIIQDFSPQQEVEIPPETPVAAEETLSEIIIADNIIEDAHPQTVKQSAPTTTTTTNKPEIILVEDEDGNKKNYNVMEATPAPLAEDASIFDQAIALVPTFYISPARRRMLARLGLNKLDNQFIPATLRLR